MATTLTTKPDAALVIDEISINGKPLPAGTAILDVKLPEPQPLVNAAVWSLLQRLEYGKAAALARSAWNQAMRELAARFTPEEKRSIERNYWMPGKHGPQTDFGRVAATAFWCFVAREHANWKAPEDAGKAFEAELARLRGPLAKMSRGVTWKRGQELKADAENLMVTLWANFRDSFSSLLAGAKAVNAAEHAGKPQEELDRIGNKAMEEYAERERYEAYSRAAVAENARFKGGMVRSENAAAERARDLHFRLGYPKAQAARILFDEGWRCGQEGPQERLLVRVEAKAGRQETDSLPPIEPKGKRHARTPELERLFQALTDYLRDRAKD